MDQNCWFAHQRFPAINHTTCSFPYKEAPNFSCVNLNTHTFGKSLLHCFAIERTISQSHASSGSTQQGSHALRHSPESYVVDRMKTYTPLVRCFRIGLNAKIGSHQELFAPDNISCGTELVARLLIVSTTEDARYAGQGTPVFNEANKLVSGSLQPNEIYNQESLVRESGRKRRICRLNSTPECRLMSDDV